MIRKVDGDYRYGIVVYVPESVPEYFEKSMLSRKIKIYNRSRMTDRLGVLFSYFFSPPHLFHFMKKGEGKAAYYKENTLKLY